MFSRRPSLWLRGLFFILLSAGLLICNQRSDVFHRESARVSAHVSYPLMLLVDAPLRFFHWIVVSVTSQQDLLSENAKLRAQTILLQAELQRLLVLQKENAQLRQLLQSTPKIGGRVSIARLLSVAQDPHLQSVILDRGAQDQVYEGQPVLDAFGVMGQVVDVGERSSHVLLITDKQSAIPVEDYRTGGRAVAVGTGDAGGLTLITVPTQNDISVGDLFVTSGLGLHYPPGYPVGIVESVNPLELKPTAHLDQTQQVLLVWGDASANDKIK